MGRRLPNNEGRGVGDADNGLLLPLPLPVHMDDMLLWILFRSQIIEMRRLGSISLRDGFSLMGDDDGD